MVLSERWPVWIERNYRSVMYKRDVVIFVPEHPSPCDTLGSPLEPHLLLMHRIGDLRIDKERDMGFLEKKLFEWLMSYQW